MTLVALCRPYNSPLLGASLARLRVPVVWTDDGSVPWMDRLDTLPLDGIAARWPQRPPRLLTALEGCLQPLARRFPAWPALRWAELCKDKAAFRAATASLHPDLRCEVLTAPRAFSAEELARQPLIAKPVRGISSHGVRVLRGGDAVVAASPASPVLIEDLIGGPELAIDGYFDADGRPVVLGILQHDFADAEDVSDTLYRTSREIVRRHLAGCSEALAALNRLLGFRDFPFHYEVRADPSRGYVPIEMNPLRFAGYGTCEIGWWAFGIDPYAHFVQATAPDWPSILADGDEAGFAVVCVSRQVADLAAIGRAFRGILEVRPLSDPEAAGGALVLVREPDEERLRSYASAWRT